jgi:glycosyltransferase involved in cell wall biosynthesis
MRILFITPFNIFPPYWGGGQRTYHLVKNLARNHEVYLIFPSYPQFQNVRPENYQKELRDLGVKIYQIGNWLKWQIIEFLNVFFMLKCLHLIFSKKIDLIICDYPWSGAYALFSHFLTFKPYIFLEHNIEYEVKRQTKSRYVMLMKFLEMVLCKFAKFITVVSKEDYNKLLELKVDEKKILIMENGFDSERFYPNEEFNEEVRNELGVKNNPLVFFCGKFDYAPNVEALYTIRWIILPKVLEKNTSTKFLIVGGGRKEIDFELLHPSIIFTGVVDNIERYLNASDVVIVPITKGSGTRIKILEAIACKKIVISTKKGAEGLINKLTKPLLKITDDWNAFSNYIIESLHSKNVKDSKEFEERYAWKNIYKKMDETLVKLFEKNR